QAPPLGSAQRPGLHDDDQVAHARRAQLVVRLDLARAPDDLAVERVLDPVLDLDHDGLLHLVADHVAAARLAVATLLSDGGRLVVRLVSHRYHTLALRAVRMPSSRSRRIV